GPLGADVGPALAWVQREDERLQTEAAAIAALRAVPALDVRAGALASVANTLFETYHRLAVGRPRLAVRPGLLLRLVDELQEVRDGMQAAADEGLDAAHHRDNIADVARQVELWRQEHLAAARLRQGANDGEVAAALNEEVSAVLDAYNAEVAEQAEHAIDLEAVRALCDRMDELEGQMEALRHVPGLEGHAQNLVVVGDALGMLQVTYDAMCARRRTP
ncbi:MAG TPA: hypothetical protein VFH51_15515, partial [Myxococcota bacterium]|nr:hypothetical protein [Myxococcota bacterium]